MSDTIHVSEGVEETIETASEKMQEEATHFGEKAGQAMHHVREAGSEARRAAQQRFGHMRDTAGEYLEQGRAQMQEMGQSLEHRIHEQPFRAILMAIGLGFLLGILWPRHR